MLAYHLQFHVEELSMEAFLNGLLPRVLPHQHTFEIFPYPGKAALLRKIETRLKGYSSWMSDNYRIFVVVDCDNDDCKVLKSQLEQFCCSAGLRSRQTSLGADWQVVTRIAIEELEAWYFGDWPAVCAAYPRLPANVPRRAPYRNPDKIRGGTWEAFERLLKKHGYFKQGLPKVQAAAEVAKHINPENNRSHSFSVFRNTIAEAIAQ